MKRENLRGELEVEFNIPHLKEEIYTMFILSTTNTQTGTKWLQHSNNSFISGKANNYEGQSTQILYFTVAFDYSCFSCYLSLSLRLHRVISVFLSFHTSIIIFIPSQRVGHSLCVFVCVVRVGITVRANHGGGHPSLSSHLTLMPLGEMHSYVSS